MTCLAAYDSWPVAVETSHANGLTATVADLNSHRWSPTLTPTVVWASPPCQPFSTGGKNAGQADPRDGFPAYSRALATLRPPVTIMENVRGLSFKAHRPYLDRIVAALEVLGYAVEWRVLNAADYGVPQARQRLMLIGRMDGGAIVWPEPTVTRRTTMGEALGLGPKGSTYRDDRTYVTVNNWPHIVGTLSLQRRQNGAPPVNVLTKPAPTLTVTALATSQWQLVDTRGPVPKVTKLTTEQAAKLQAFPPGFRFAGTLREVHTQIGNAVPPPLAHAVTAANVPA